MPSGGTEQANAEQANAPQLFQWLGAEYFNAHVTLQVSSCAHSLNEQLTFWHIMCARISDHAHHVLAAFFAAGTQGDSHSRCMYSRGNQMAL